MSERARLAEDDLSKAVEVERLRARLPDRPRVIRIDARSYVDHADEDAILVQVVLDDDTTDDELRSDSIDDIRETIANALKEDDRFPYVRFATQTEIDEMHELDQD